MKTVADAQRIIVACPYDSAKVLPRVAWPLARLLAKHGLLEENSWTPGLFRCTSRGMQVRHRLLHVK